MRKFFCMLLLIPIFACIAPKTIKVNADNSIPVPILMYHSVLKDCSNTFIISTKQLEQDFSAIKNMGYTAITMTQLISYVYGNTKLPEKPIIITFDDGYYNNYLYVYPLLKKYDLKAVFSVVGSFAELHSGGKQSPNYSHLTYAQCKEMQESGYVEIQNHTYNLHNHKSNIKGLKKKTGETTSQYVSRIMDDIDKMQKVLQKNCDCSPNTFAYPFGIYNETAEKALKDYGFKAILTCNYGTNHISKDCSLSQLKRYNRSGKVNTNTFFKQIGLC